MLVLRDGEWIEIDAADLRSNDIAHKDILMPARSNPSPLLNQQPQSLPPQKMSLHQAVSQNKIDVVREYIASKAPLSSIDDEGNTPLHIAVDKGRKNLFWELLNAGADITIRNKDSHAPLYKPTSHFGLASEVWQKRTTLPQKDKIIEGCFVVLSFTFLNDLEKYHRDLLELLNGASSEKIQIFAEKKLKGHMINPLNFLIYHDPLYVEIAQRLLDHAKVNALTAKNSSGNSFLTIAPEQLIHYASTCQGGKFAAAIKRVAAKHAVPEAVPQPPVPSNASTTKLKLKSLEKKLAATHAKIQETRDAIQASRSTIQLSEALIEKNTGVVAELTLTAADLKQKVEACSNLINELEKNDLMQQVAENHKLLQQFNERQKALETQAAKLGISATIVTYRPTTGVKRARDEMEGSSHPAPPITPSPTPI